MGGCLAAKALVIGVAYLLTIVVGFLIESLLKMIEKDIDPGEIERGGFIIGVLERVIIVTLVLVGAISSVSVIFAGKSIARFDALKNRKIAEYYLIGTFMSMAFALVIGLVSKQIAGLR